MKNTKIPTVLMPVLLMLSILLTSCGAKAQPVATTEPTVTVTSYTLTHVESGIIRYNADEFGALGTIDYYSDGTATLFYGDQEIQLVYDDSNMWSAENEEELHPYSISGLVLTLDYFSETLTFVQKEGKPIPLG